MKLQMRRTGFFAAAVLTVTAVLGEAVPAIVASLNPEQTTPAAQSPAPPTAKVRELTLEERADIFMARKNYADATDYYFRALKQVSFQDPKVWNKLGISYQVQGEFRGARKAYNKAVHLNKSFAEAWNNIGTVYCMEKKYSKSVKYYKRAITLMNDNAPFHMNLGTSYYHMKKFDLAEAEYHTALSIDPKVLVQDSATGTIVHASGTGMEFYFYMAKAFASIGDAEDAVRYLRRALEDGYKDSKKIGEDPDFMKISKYPAFVELLRNPPVAIKE